MTNIVGDSGVPDLRRRAPQLVPADGLPGLALGAPAAASNALLAPVPGPHSISRVQERKAKILCPAVTSHCCALKHVSLSDDSYLFVEVQPQDKDCIYEHPSELLVIHRLDT